MCAIALCVGGLIGPPGAALALLAVPLPALVVGGVAGVSHAAASSLAAGGLLGGLLGWPVGASFLALAGAPAVLAVLMLRRAWRLEPVVSAAVAATCAGGAVLAVLFAPEAGSWTAALADAWRSSFDGAVAMYRDLGMSAEQLAELEGQRDAARALRPALPAGPAGGRRLGALARQPARLRPLGRLAAAARAVALAHAGLGRLAADRLRVRPVRAATRSSRWSPATSSPS